MRIAGGVIAIVVGVIQTILMALAVFAADAVDTMMTDEQRQQLEESAAGGDANAQAAMEAMSSVGWYLWVFLIVSIIVVILGIMICSSKNPMNGLLLAVIGAVLVVLAIVFSAGILSILWNALFLLAGILGYMGAKQQSSVPAA